MVLRKYEAQDSKIICSWIKDAKQLYQWSADKIIVLNKGMIAETGTHAELMEKNGIYRQMYRLQRESEQWSA